MSFSNEVCEEQDYEKSIAQQVVNITQNQIDSTYIQSTDYVEEFIEKPSKLLCVAVGSAEEFEVKEVGRELPPSYNVKILGYLLCGSYQYREYAEYLYTDIDNVLGQTDYIGKEDFPIFLFQSMAVRDDYQGQGIGSALVGFAAEDYAHSPYFAGVWKREKEPYILKICRKYGTHIGDVEDYYPDDWDCPYCDGACSCSSAFYAFKPEG